MHFCRSGLWGCLGLVLCSGSHKAAMKVIFKLYFHVKVEVGKNILPSPELIHVGIQFLLFYD